MYIKDIMTTEVITVKEEDTVEKCANLLSVHHFSGLPVVNEQNEVIGIVTEGDLIRRASRIEGPAFLEILGGIIYLENPNSFLEDVRQSMGSFARNVMSKDPVTVEPSLGIEDAATLLVQKNIKRLPVVDEKKQLIGIVSRKDIMNHLFHNE
ncbi:MAG TPA: CBS domain-containing protein [Pseudogracilibacillus sp.]|nr:CBS domain-containing protein [Pseudogracilibacillus sp.]